MDETRGAFNSKSILEPIKEQTGDISIYLDKAFEEIDRLSDNVKHLNSKLNLILSDKLLKAFEEFESNTYGKVKEKKEAKTAKSQLASNIKLLSERIYSINNIIDDISRRIDL